MKIIIEFDEKELAAEFDDPATSEDFIAEIKNVLRDNFSTEFKVSLA